PTDLGHGLIALGLPYRWAYALITALRLEPLFSQQARMVYWAQLTRGVRYDTGPLLRRWLMLRRLLLPLIVSSLRAAADVSGAMENRCFGMYKRRTSVRPIRFEVADALAIAGGLVFFVVLSVAI
ncbi:MAG: energy-coupling factor transporter transmembrane component T, partial [Planctomycetota bacterium]